MKKRFFYLTIITLSLCGCFSNSDADIARKKLGLYIDENVNLGPKRRPVGNVEYEGKSADILKLEAAIDAELNAAESDDDEVDLDINEGAFADLRPQTNNSYIQDQVFEPVDNPAFEEYDPVAMEAQQEKPSFWQRIKNFFTKSEAKQNEPEIILDKDDDILQNNNRPTIRSKNLDNDDYPKLGHIGKRPKVYSSQEDVNKLIREVDEDLESANGNNLDYKIEQNHQAQDLAPQQNIARQNPAEEDDIIENLEEYRQENNIDLHEKDAYKMWYADDDNVEYDLIHKKKEFKLNEVESVENPYFDNNDKIIYENEQSHELIPATEYLSEIAAEQETSENYIDQNERNLYHKPKRIRYLKPSRYAR